MNDSSLKISNKAIFLDRDGVINQEIGYLHKIEDFVFIDGVFDACHFLVNQGYKIIIITNQSGIGRGYYSLDQYLELTEWMFGEFSKRRCGGCQNIILEPG